MNNPGLVIAVPASGSGKTVLTLGLFDGAFVGKGETCGSTAGLSRVTGWPVVLVIDAGAFLEGHCKLRNK